MNNSNEHQKLSTQKYLILQVVLETIKEEKKIYNKV